MLLLCWLLGHNFIAFRFEGFRNDWSGRDHDGVFGFQAKEIICTRCGDVREVGEEVE